jgi:tetratricopeptide (TPR) repeat protein
MVSPSTFRMILSLLILTGTVIFTFGGVIDNQFLNWDDQAEIFDNTHLNPVTWEGLAWNWTNTQMTLYMPVTYTVWGGVASIAPRDADRHLQPRAFHALNLCLHLVCAWLVFGLIVQLWKRILPALIGALLFAVHPIQVEAVAWASGMYTLLSAALSLLAIIAYLTYSAERGKARFFWLATLLFVLAMLSKAASVSVPVMIIALDVLVRGRSFKRSLLPMALWCLIALPIVIAAKHFQDLGSITLPPVWTRPIIALDAMGFYLRKILLPVHLIPDYGRNPAWVVRHAIPVLISVAIAMVAIIIAFAARKKAAWITAGLSLMFAGVLPYLGLTAFDFQYVSTVADRYAYVAMIGAALLAAGAAARSRAASGLLLITILVWIPLSRAQCRHWHDTRRLFSFVLAVNPDSLVSHNIFGYFEAQQDRFDPARAHYLKALQVWPEDAVIHFNLGNLDLRQAAKQPADRQQLLDDAIEHFSLAVKYAPPRFSMYRNALGVALAQQGNLQAAFNEWSRTIADDPNCVDAHNNLADLLAGNGNIPSARSHCAAVLRLDPHNAHALAQLRKMEKQ